MTSQRQLPRATLEAQLRVYRAALQGGRAERLLQEVCAASVEQAGVAGARIWACRDGQPACLAEAGTVTDMVHGQPLAARALAQGRITASSGAEVAVPVRVGGDMVLALAWCAAPGQAFDAQDVAGLQALAEDLGLALGQAVPDEMTRARQAQARADEATRASRAKSEFISRMGHELRTPLNAVLGFGQLLEREAGHLLQPEHHEYLRQGRQAGVHLLGLIDDLLDMAGIEAGQLRVQPRAIDLDAVLTAAGAVVQGAAREAGVCLQLHAGAARPVVADATRLRQVLINLLSNGIKYNVPGGHVKVTVRSLEGSPEGPLAGGADEVEITVADNGQGMDPVQCSRLFEPFNRLGRERGTVPGHGIGLALSRQLVHAMGGRLAVDSTLGRGTCVTVTLPAAGIRPRGEAPAGRPPPLDGLPPVRPGRGRRTLLYIEDNPVNVLLLEHVLARWPDIELLKADSGSKGLAIACTHRPDLVLLDLHLPDLDGETVLRELRAHPLTSDLRVVVLSADTGADVAEAVRRLGAVDCWAKPLDLRIVEPSLGRWLDLSPPVATCATAATAATATTPAASPASAPSIAPGPAPASLAPARSA